MIKTQYKSIGDWRNHVVSDWNKSWKSGNSSNIPVELIILQVANFILLTFLFYRFAIFVAPYIGFIKNENVLAASLIFAWEALLKALNHLGFSVAKRFNVFEVFRFNLKSSYYIYITFFLLNIAAMLPCKYLTFNKYARGK